MAAHVDMSVRLARQWDYQTVTMTVQDTYPSSKGVPSVDLLDQLGAAGWELVTAVPILGHGITDRVHYLFRRPR